MYITFILYFLNIKYIKEFCHLINFKKKWEACGMRLKWHLPNYKLIIWAVCKKATESNLLTWRFYTSNLDETQVFKLITITNALKVTTQSSLMLTMMPMSPKHIAQACILDHSTFWVPWKGHVPPAVCSWPSAEAKTACHSFRWW